MFETSLPSFSGRVHPLLPNPKPCQIKHIKESDRPSGVFMPLSVSSTFCVLPSLPPPPSSPQTTITSIHPAALIKRQDVPQPLWARGGVATSQRDGREATRGPKNHHKSLPRPPSLTPLSLSLQRKVSAALCGKGHQVAGRHNMKGGGLRERKMIDE